MAKAFIDDENLTDIADAIRATLDVSRQYLPSEMAAAIQSIPIMAQLNRKKYYQSVPVGAASGYATIEQIEGNTVKFIQLCKHNLISWRASNKLEYDSDTDIIAAKSTASGTLFQANVLPPLIGHVFYVSLEYKASTTITFSCYSIPSAMTAISFTELSARSSFTRVASIATRSTSIAPTENWALSMYKNQSGTGLEIKLGSIFLADLTDIFGSGNEPTTVADFEAWMQQNGLPSIADYNAGELLSVKMSGMQTEDSSQQVVDTIALDVTTITGINTSTNVREVIFPNGMKQADYAGTVKDTLDLRSDTATVNVGSRAYQSGDESDPDVLTDGTTTYYALTTPIEYTDLQDQYGNPLNPRYKVEQGGTEQVLPVNTSTPTTVAPTLTTTYTKDNN